MYSTRFHLTKRPNRFKNIINLFEPIAIGEHILESEAVAVVLQKLQGLIVVLGVTRHDAQDRELFLRDEAWRQADLVCPHLPDDQVTATSTHHRDAFGKRRCPARDSITMSGPRPPVQSPISPVR